MDRAHVPDGIPLVLLTFALGAVIGIAGTCLYFQGERNSLESPPPPVGTKPAAERGEGPARGTEPVTFVAEGPASTIHDEVLERADPPLATEPEAEIPSLSDETIDTIDAIRLTLENPSTAGKRDYLALLQNLTPEEAPKMIRLFRELGSLGYAVSDYDRLFWQRWAEIDGPAASALIFDRDKRFEETGLSNLAISTWAKQDPEAAKAWLLDQEDIPLRQGMMNGLIEGMAENDPAAALRFLEESNLPPNHRAKAYTQIARQFQMQFGLESVGSWYTELAPGHPHHELVAVATTQAYARAPFAEALNWANSLDGSSTADLRTRDSLHANLANSRPDGLVRYLGHTDGADQLGGVAPLTERAVARWTQANPGAMANWLKGNRNMRNYDLVAAPFVLQIASQDPEAASAWADTLRDPDLKQEITERLGTIGNAAR